VGTGHEVNSPKNLPHEIVQVRYVKLNPNKLSELYMQYIFHGLTFVSHSSLLTTKSVDFVVGTLWLPFIMEFFIVLIAEVFSNSCCFVCCITG